MSNTRLPFNRLDKFITRKKEELAGLLSAEDTAPPGKSATGAAKVAHLRKVIVKAKAEVTHLESKLTDSGTIKTRLSYLESEYQNHKKRLQEQITNSAAYREISTEIQRLPPRIQLLRKKLQSLVDDK